MHPDPPPRRRLDVLAQHLKPQSVSDVAPDALRPASAAAPAVVIGGIVMDVQARPQAGGAGLQAGGSVPGTVTHTPGGVARNIAVSLAQRLGPQQPRPLLVSCVGRDAAGGALVDDLSRRGLPLRGVLRPPGAATATVSIVFDAAGEVAAAVADVSALERALTPAVLASEFPHDVAAAPLLIVDANLSPAALQEVCSTAGAAGVAVWLEPVSAPKAVRAASVLRHLAFVSPNAAELVSMARAACEAQQQQPWQRSDGTQQPLSPAQQCDQQAQGLRQLRNEPLQRDQRQQGAEAGGGARRLVRPLAPHLAVLLQAGVQHVALTLGAAGAALATLERTAGASSSGGGTCTAGGGGPGSSLDISDGQCTIRVTHMPAEPAAVATTSGAGDCLVAGAAAALLQGCPPEEALAHGMAAAHAAVESDSNVPRRCDATAERQRAKRIYAARQTWTEAVDLQTAYRQCRPAEQQS